MLSNDVKWNKIQEIIRFLYDVEYESYTNYQDCMDSHNAAKLAHRDTWILANQIYDVAVDGCYCHIKITPYYDKAHHWQYTINRVLSLGDYGNENLEILYKFRDKYWEEYDYLNS